MHQFSSFRYEKEDNDDDGNDDIISPLFSSPGLIYSLYSHPLKRYSSSTCICVGVCDWIVRVGRRSKTQPEEQPFWVF